MLKKYDELTKEQKEKVKVMYSDLDTLKQYLYNFDDNGKYTGRQYTPPEGETKSGIHFGSIHFTKDEPIEKENEQEIKIKSVKKVSKKK
jgi:hypothetical protein